MIILSLGGSLIVPEEIDTAFLKKFRSLILKQIKKGKKFIIMCGGGKTARLYQKGLFSFSKSKTDLDWIGIHSTRLNAELIRSIFKKYSFPEVITNPTKKVKTNKPLLIACGWKPGCSTDYDAVLLAKTYKVKTIMNLSNIDFVYNKDPKKFRDAKPIKKIKWNDFLKIIGEKWKPGLNVPFDPVASRIAKRLRMKAVILNGKNLENLENALDKKGFAGTEIF